jgi:hypothetical protein
MNALRNGTIPISSRKMVRFTPNMPVEVALQCTDGVRIEGRYGDRVKYTLTDDRTMYVDPLVAERIKELDVQPGEAFQICKCRDKKTIVWLVRRDCGLGSQLERDLLASLERVRNPTPTPLASPSPGPSSPMATVTTELPPNTFDELEKSPPNNRAPHTRHEPNGSVQTPASAAPILAKDAAPPLPSTQLAHALKTAISAAADAEKFAKTLDYNIRFTTDDIRSMGITVLIGMQQRMPR